MNFKKVMGNGLCVMSILVILLITHHLLLITPVLAAEDFATSYDVTYEVGVNGITTVTEKITLRNLTSQYYATSFSLTIGSTEITDVSASDPAGPIQVETKQDGTSTTLTVKFNQQIAGVDKTLPWTLTFKSKDFATALGKVWEVSVPKVVSTQNLEAYNVTLSVPASFGSPTSISPPPRKQTQSFDRLFLTFDKEQLKASGVSSSFGINQLFDFDLTYHLENPGLATLLTNIALPPDTAYQDVIFQRIDPKPLNVTLDDDGNYLAWYKLGRREKTDVKVVGSSKLYSNSKVKNPTLDPVLKNKYLSADKYWQTDHPAIKTRLSEIFGTEKNLSNIEKAELIHRHVASSLKYDSGRLNTENIERLGAVTALNNPNSAVCMEFTDLFITLARASGIRARELDGFAYTANPKLRPLSLSGDILHAWPEFYDESKGWIMIDPTWENTTGGVDYFNKLDLNHFVFAIKGLSSEQPVPAGSYKYAGQNSTDVKVTFASKDFLGKPQLDVEVDTPGIVLAGFPGKLKVKVANLGNSIQQASNLGISSSKLTILDGGIRNLGPIPAFGHADFEYNIRTKSLIESYDDTIEVMVGGQKFTKPVMVRPFIIFQSFPWILVGLVGAIAIIYFAVLGGFLYRKRFSK